MPKHNEYKEIARAVLAHTAGVLALAERWLRRADQLDYVVRRRLKLLAAGWIGSGPAISETGDVVKTSPTR